MRLLVLTAILALSLPAVAPAQSLGQAEINAAIQVASDAQPADSDPFSEPRASSLSGRAIRLEYPILMEGSEGASPALVWTYSRDRKELAFQILPRDFQISTTFMDNGRFIIPVSADVTGFVTETSRSREGTEQMSNAYGASVEVTNFRERTFGVAEVSQNYQSSLPGNQQSFYRYKISLEPEDARALTADLKWVVQGEVHDWTPGRSVLCGSNYYEPSFRNPVQVSGSTCLLTVEFVSFAIVNGQTGEVLQEWRSR